jgi:two-component system invasion response regulator UvrY
MGREPPAVEQTVDAMPRRSGPVIRVLVADDHPVVRRGLQHILAETPDIVAVGEASTGNQVLDQVRAGTCDVLLLDLTMPGGHGVEILEAVKRERPALPVLVLSIHPEDQYAVRVFRAGAAGYMTKDSAADELVRAVRKVHAGGRYVTPRVAEELAAQVDRATERQPHALLSNREYQVLCMLGKALSVTQIARELHLSEKTVSTYRSRLLEKIQARSTAELIRYAVQNRLVD